MMLEKDIYIYKGKEVVFFNEKPEFVAGESVKINGLSRKIHRVFEERDEYRWKVELVSLFQ